MTTFDAIEEARQEELEEWGHRFSCVADDASDHGWSLLDAPEDQLPYELLDWAMATMQGIARLLRAASDELFPLDDDLKESIARMFESSAQPKVVKPVEAGERRG